MRSLGFAYDWTREVNTSDPEYYRWNQWFFLRLWERDMVYRRFSKVNWCTGCLTVIANEQVKDGRCERCDSPVVERQMPEWAFRITRNSEDLLQALDGLTDWPERITSSQRNWIGKSEGAEADFKVPDGRAIRVFTTRIDTVYGATVLVLAPDHPMVPGLTEPSRRAEVGGLRRADRGGHQDRAHRRGRSQGGRLHRRLRHQPLRRSAGPDLGRQLRPQRLRHGSSHGRAGTRQPGLRLRPDLRPANQARSSDRPMDGTSVRWRAGPRPSSRTASSSTPGSTPVSPPRRHASGWGRRSRSAALGKPTVTYRQKDWGFSRQRYWGTPIPIVYCERCDPERKGILVPDDQLPVRLPEIDTQAVLTGKGEPPLAKVKSFVETTCPRCGGPARREVETMDAFVDSSWYYARYLSPHYDQAPFDPKLAHRWLPVDIYVGGPEHAVMHLLYFRFWSRWMKILGLVPTDEPVKRLVTQGIVNGPDGRKMSKRWGNVVAPATIVEKYGADTVRTYVLFAGPPDQDFDWSDKQMQGAHRFLNRVWALAASHQETAARATHQGPFEGRALQIRRAAHKCVKRVGGGHRPALVQHRHRLHHGVRQHALRRRSAGDSGGEGCDGGGHPAPHPRPDTIRPAPRGRGRRGATERRLPR
jgi:leucyl-tRNA synthetase